MIYAIFLSLRNVVKLCGTKGLYQDSPDDIANGLLKIAGCFKQRNNSINGFISRIFLVMIYIDGNLLDGKSSAYKRNK